MGTIPSLDQNAMALWQQREAHREAVKKDLLASGVDEINASAMAFNIAHARREWKSDCSPAQVNCVGCGAPKETDRCGFCGRADQ